MARRAVWTRVMHRSGLERPHFVATETVAVAPAHEMEAGSKNRLVVAHGAARIQSEPVRRVRIAHCIFCFSNFFTR
jgi:hypothetical protein